MRSAVAMQGRMQRRQRRCCADLIVDLVSRPNQSPVRPGLLMEEFASNAGERDSGCCASEWLVKRPIKLQREFGRRVNGGAMTEMLRVIAPQLASTGSGAMQAQYRQYF